MNDQDKKNQRISRSALIVGIFSLLTVGSWVGFDVYRSLVKTTIPPDVQKQIQPLDSKIDPNLMSDLKSRRSFTDSELNSVHPNTNLITSASGSATPSKVARIPISNQIASPSAESTQSARGKL